jgi:hypothetical protein
MVAIAGNFLPREGTSDLVASKADEFVEACLGPRVRPEVRKAGSTMLQKGQDPIG